MLFNLGRGPKDTESEVYLHLYVILFKDYELTNAMMTLVFIYVSCCKFNIFIGARVKSILYV